MIAELKKTLEAKMQKSLEVLKNDLQKIRTGRAHTGLLDHVQVDYYGSMVPVNQVYHWCAALGKAHAAKNREGDSRL